MRSNLVCALYHAKFAASTSKCIAGQRVKRGHKPDSDRSKFPRNSRSRPSTSSRERRHCLAGALLRVKNNPSSTSVCFMSTGLYTGLNGGVVEEPKTLKALNTLLEMTNEAAKLSSEGEQVERIKTLISEIRRKAQLEHERIRGKRPRESPNPTRYELCMIGIREEFGRGIKSVPNLPALSASLRRIHEEIDRTIREIKAKQLVM